METTSVKYPEVAVRLSGYEKGDTFAVLGACFKAARRAGLTAEQRAEFQAEATVGDYDHLLQTCMKYFDVT